MKFYNDDNSPKYAYARNVSKFIMHDDKMASNLVLSYRVVMWWHQIGVW